MGKPVSPPKTKQHSLSQPAHPSSPGFKQWGSVPGSSDLLGPFHSYDQHQAAQNLNYYMYLQSQVKLKVAHIVKQSFIAQ